MHDYDIIIIGAGPAGLASAISIKRLAPLQRILVIEKGSPLSQRKCLRQGTNECLNCNPCKLLSGVGGASGILGGKLCFFPAGERLAKMVGKTCESANEMVTNFLRSLGCGDWLKASESATSSDSHGSLRLKAYPTSVHLRQDFADLFSKLDYVARRHNVTIIPDAEVLALSAGQCGNRFSVTASIKGGLQHLSARHAVIWAGGRSGWERLANTLGNVGASCNNDVVDVGLRLVMPTGVTAPIPSGLDDPKFTIRKGTPNEIRTLCWTVGGELTFPRMFGHTFVDGHFGRKLTSMASVSIVARVPVPSGACPIEAARNEFPFTEYDLPLRESVIDFLRNNGSSRRGLPHLSGPLHDANISKLMSPSLRDGLSEMILELNSLLEGRVLNCRETCLVGPVLDKFWGTPVLDEHLMSDIPGLYVVGDATGKARGIIQAIFSGLVISRAISELNSVTVGNCVSRDANACDEGVLADV